MKLIVGLGNPGEKYQNNRHNAGFMFVEHMAKWLHGCMVDKNNNAAMKQFDHGDFTYKNHLNSEIATFSFNNTTIVLSKPRTFMNLCGLAVKKLTENWKLEIENLIIVHDDLDIPLGKFKIQKGVGPQLHNGILSIEQHLKTKDFWRIRIGVDNRTRENWMDGETYVLQDFTLEEKQNINQTFPKIISSLQSCLTIF